MNEKTKIIARNGIIAALYVALTWLSMPIAYGVIQFRISEILVLLCFFRKDYVVSLTVACAIANIFSPEIGLLDVLIGTSATLVACLGICLCKHLWVAAIIPVVANGLIVGLELAFFTNIGESFFYCAGFVALGEFVVMVAGYILFMLCMKKEKSLNLVCANRNREFRC